MGKERVSLRSLRDHFEGSLKSEVGAIAAEALKNARRVRLSSAVPRQNMPVAAPMEEQRKKNKTKPPLRDSIQFKTSRQHEEYLNAYLEEHGLTWELYDQYKVLYSSARELGELHRVWRHLGDLGFQESQILLEKAEVLRQMGEMDKAQVFLDENVRKYPGDPHANYALAMFYKLTRDYELAIHWLKKWQKLEGMSAEPYYHLGAIYRRTGSLDMARTSLLECLRLKPNHPLGKSLLQKLDQ